MKTSVEEFSGLVRKPEDVAIALRILDQNWPEGALLVPEVDDGFLLQVPRSDGSLLEVRLPGIRWGAQQERKKRKAG